MNVILIVIIVVILIAFIRFLKIPHIYFDVECEKTIHFLYVLLYRGYLNGSLLIEKRQSKRIILFSKYKERNEVGLALKIPLYLDNSENNIKIQNIIDENSLDYISENTNDPEIKNIIKIYFRNEFNFMVHYFIEFSKLVFSENDNCLFDLRFYKVCTNSEAVIGFEGDEIPDFRKLKIDISLPILNFNYYNFKLGAFVGKIFSLFRKP